MMTSERKESGAQADPAKRRVPNEGDLRLGERIHRVRTQHGLKRGQMAARLDVTSQAIVRWEKGYGVKRDNLSRIAVEFNVSFNWLATGEGLPMVPAVPLETRIAQALPEREALEFLEEIELLLNKRAERAKNR